MLAHQVPVVQPHSRELVCVAQSLQVLLRIARGLLLLFGRPSSSSPSLPPRPPHLDVFRLLHSIFNSRLPAGRDRKVVVVVVENPDPAVGVRDVQQVPQDLIAESKVDRQQRRPQLDQFDLSVGVLQLVEDEFEMDAIPQQRLLELVQGSIEACLHLFPTFCYLALPQFHILGVRQHLILSPTPFPRPLLEPLRPHLPTSLHRGWPIWTLGLVDVCCDGRVSRKIKLVSVDKLAIDEDVSELNHLLIRGPVHIDQPSCDGRPHPLSLETSPR
eukprot:766951-Hanusia_phi.AAC.6